MANPTRGYGLLEGYLARRRAALANRLIPESHRHGKLLDVGCGTFPYFLTRTAFAHKIGVDKVVPADGHNGHAGVQLHHFDIDQQNTLPFADNGIDVVTMLAVFEHIRVDRLVVLLNEIHRVLRPGGAYVLTTPNGWTGPLLDCLKTLRLISPMEINEHQDSYGPTKIRAVLNQSEWTGKAVRFGYFEMFANVWATLEK